MSNELLRESLHFQDQVSLKNETFFSDRITIQDGETVHSVHIGEDWITDAQIQLGRFFIIPSEKIDIVQEMHKKPALIKKGEWLTQIGPSIASLLTTRAYLLARNGQQEPLQEYASISISKNTASEEIGVIDVTLYEPAGVINKPCIPNNALLGPFRTTLERLRTKLPQGSDQLMRIYALTKESMPITFLSKLISNNFTICNLQENTYGIDVYFTSTYERQTSAF